MTRSSRGARCVWSARALGVGLLVLGLVPVFARPAAAARPERGPGPLPWRIGYEVGFSADAAAFPDSTGNTVEVYLRIRPSLIADLTSDGNTSPPIHVTAELKPLFGGGKSETREQTFTVVPADTAGEIGQVVVMSFHSRPGRHRLALALETRRRELSKRGMEKPEKAHVEGELTVPAIQAGRQISDLEFVWGDRRMGTPGTGRGRRDLIPNPERLYGLYATGLRAYFSARATEAKPWQWVARAIDSTGAVVATQQGTAPATVLLEGNLAMDVSELPAGAYDLEVKTWQEGDAGALLRRSRFSVAWQPETWTRDPLAAADETHFLLSSDEEEDFPTLTPGEQERAMDRFWVLRDPTPDTAENEARREYLKRVQFANRTYGRFGLGRGMFSDMGRTFIRYGEPSEVVRQVMPSLDDNIRNIIMELAATEGRSIGSVTDHEAGADTRPFELWIYEGNIPLPIEADPTLGRSRVSGKRLVFLFVDSNWLGDYRLLYSGE